MLFRRPSRGETSGNEITKALTEQQGLKRDIERLEGELGALQLRYQALWELIRDKLPVSEEELARLTEEIDMRDGVADGRITQQPTTCPACNRLSAAHHRRCMYCGQSFE